jgi:hypothetical protein
MVQLVTFEAIFYGSLTPMTPDMVPLIFEARGSISFSLHKSDFITPIHPIHGILAAFKSKGYGTHL